MADEERVLRRVPNHGETLEHEGILIEWDFPKPSVKPVKWHPNTQSWYKRLSPLKMTPNRRARVCRDLPSAKVAAYRTTRIRKSLREKDPRSKWKIEQAKADDGTFGVWVTYQGVMTEKEYNEDQARHTYHSLKTKGALAAAQQRRVIQRSRLNPTLRPPVVGPND